MSTSCVVVRAARRKYAPRLPASERREQLLDVALELIAEHGQGGVTMEAVARGADIAKPVVYDLFGNRGELLQALLEREERSALEQLAGVVPELPVGDPDEILVSAMTGFLAAVAAHPDRWRLILIPVEGTPQLVREHVEQGRRALLAQVERLVSWGLEQRGGPEGLDPELSAHVIIALGEGAARMVLTQPERMTPERLGAFTGRLISAIERSDPQP